MTLVARWMRSSEPLPAAQEVSNQACSPYAERGDRGGFGNSRNLSAGDSHGEIVAKGGSVVVPEKRRIEETVHIVPGRRADGVGAGGPGVVRAEDAAGGHCRVCTYEWGDRKPVDARRQGNVQSRDLDGVIEEAETWIRE